MAELTVHEEAMRRARQHVLRQRMAAARSFARGGTVRLGDVLAVQWSASPAPVHVEIPPGFGREGVRSGTMRLTDVDAQWAERVYGFLARSRRAREDVIFGRADEPFQLDGVTLWSVQLGSPAAPLPQTHDEWIAAARRHVAEARFREQRERLLSEIPLTFTIDRYGGTYSISAVERPWWRPWWTYRVENLLRDVVRWLGLG